MTPLALALIQLAGQYGIPLVIELMKTIEAKGDPIAADWQALLTNYATKSAAQYLAEAQAAQAVITSGNSGATPPPVSTPAPNVSTLFPKT